MCSVCVCVLCRLKKNQQNTRNIRRLILRRRKRRRRLLLLPLQTWARSMQTRRVWMNKLHLSTVYSKNYFLYLFKIFQDLCVYCLFVDLFIIVNMCFPFIKHLFRIYLAVVEYFLNIFSNLFSSVFKLFFNFCKLFVNYL